MFENLNESLNPMCEPFDDWKYKFDESPEQRQMNLRDYGELVNGADSSKTSRRVENDFSFSCGDLGSVEDDEVTEFKIRAFLDEKAQELKKLQSPMYEAFYNTLSTTNPPVGVTVDKTSPVRSCRHTSSNEVQNPTFRDSHNAHEWEGVLADSYKEPTSQRLGVVQALARDRGNGKKSWTRSLIGNEESGLMQTEAIINQALQTRAEPNVSDAYTINGLPGPLYKCSSKEDS